MRVEARQALDEKRQPIMRGLVLIVDNKEESKLIDAVFGDKVGEDGLIGSRRAEARLSDGYGKHYIYISANE